MASFTLMAVPSCKIVTGATTQWGLEQRTAQLVPNACACAPRHRCSQARTEAVSKARFKVMGVVRTSRIRFKMACSGCGHQCDAVAPFGAG